MRKILFTIIALIFTASLGYSQVTTLWEKSAAATTLPVWESGSTTRGISYGLVGADHRFFVVNRNALLGGKQIIIFNALTGDSVSTLDTTGLAGGTYPVNDVEVSTDGVIFVGNLTTNSSTSAFKVYKYTSEVAAPVEAINYTSVAAYRLGDKFTVTGSTADNSIIIWAANAAATGEVVKFTTTDNGATFSPEVISVGTLVSFSSAAIGPLANGDFYFNAHGMNPRKHTSTGTLIGAIPGTAMGTSGSALRHMHTFLGDEYVVANDVLVSANNAKIIKVPGGVPASATLFASTPLLGSTSAGGLGDVSVQKVSDYVYNVYVLATNNGFGAYQVDLRTPLAGDYYIPKGANPQGFATLNDAVASLNINGAAGTVNFLLDADTLRENTFTFNAALSDVNNLVVKPASGRDVVLIVTASGSVGNGPFMIGFNTGYVTFDGSNNGTDSRNLLVTTEQMSPTVDVPFTLNNANADNVTLKNLIIKNIVVGQTNFRYGAVINDLGGVTGFRVENCQIGTALRPVRRDGLAPWGSGTTGANQFSFVNNEIYCGTRGVTTIYLVDSEIIGNSINILPTTAGNINNYIHGIYITGHFGSLLIHENTINILEKSNVAGTYVMGIAFAGNNSTATDIISVVNNMINVGAIDEIGSTYGIGLRSAQTMGNLKVYFNTILINNNASTLRSYAVGNHTNGTGPVNIDLKNNIIINNHTGNTGSSAIGLIPVTSVLTSNYNLLRSNQNFVNFQGTSYADLAAWQATSQDANSISKAVNFVSATNLHLAGASNGDFDLAGTPIAGITLDIDGDTRSTTYPYKGADEGTISLTVYTEVTFKVNMKVKILEGAFNTAEDSLWARGSWTGTWSATDLMTDPDGDSIYTVTVANIGSAGTVLQFKFMYRDVSAAQDRWEGDPNREYTLLDGAQIYDGGYFDRDDKVSKNISMYFSCNMELEKLSGRFDPARDTVSVNGSFQGWTPKANRLIPNPLNVDIYEGTFTILGAETESIEFKYWYTPNNWESVANRTYTFTAGDVTSGTATYTGNFNNGTLETVLNQPATLKLTVYVPPTSVSAVNGQPFPAIKTVHAAGSALPLKWPAGGWPDADSVNMVKLYDDGTHGDQTAGDKIFTNSITFAAYTVLRVEYKYGVNFGDAANNGGGNDNEQGFGSNHVLKMHRFLGSATVVDTFAAMRDPSWLKDIVLVGVEDEVEIPKVYSLSQNYPNPFNPATTIRFGLPKESAVTLMIYNILGEQVATLINNETLNAGEYNYDFNASRLASGTYIYRLTAGEFSQTKKMILLK